MSSRDKQKRDEYNRRYYEEHKEHLKESARKRSIKWCKENKDYRNARERAKRMTNPAPQRNATKRYRLRLKLEGIAAYGGKCSCCGETDPEFLTLDHVLGNGKQEREEQKKNGQFGGSSFWLKAKNEGYPPTYQILCFNCNYSTYRGDGVCAHRRSICQSQASMDHIGS